MQVVRSRYFVSCVLFLVLVNQVVKAQEEPLCVENSPERRGGSGAASWKRNRCQPISRNPHFGRLTVLIAGSVLKLELAQQASRSMPMALGG